MTQFILQKFQYSPTINFLTDINKKIKENNDIVSNKKTRINKYNEDVLCYLAEKAKNDIIQFNSIKTNIEKQIKECEAKICSLKTERSTNTKDLEALIKKYDKIIEYEYTSCPQ